MKRFDAIVVGAGAGGGVAAWTLVERGMRVLVLERGNWLDFWTSGRDHLRNHRLSQYGENTGQLVHAGDRVTESWDGTRSIVKSYQGGYQNIAMAVGSGTVVYGGQAWRYHPLDFKMASTYGVPEGSSLADWPISYRDLEPFYEQVEHMVGVSGGEPASTMPQRAPYPMPPVPLPAKGRILERAAKQLGWETQRIPLLINSIERDGRPACVNCQHCVGFACPVDAKNGTQNTVLPRALASGLCEIESGATVLHLNLQGSRVTGVSYFLDDEFVEVEADRVYVACGAIETARLLLLSKVDLPAVGRNLQGHYYANARGFFPESIYDGIGPGASVSTLDFNHHNDGIVGGGMIADDFIVLPIAFAKWHRPPEIPRWGLDNKRWMRDRYRKFISVMGPVQDIPNPNARVSLDPFVTDKFGRQVAHLSGWTHPETIRTTKFMNDRATEWLQAAGAEEIWSPLPALGLSGGQHQAGTCRMGDDPTTSVVDATGKVHGLENLYLADGSVHVTNGGFNPVLTIMALARRTASLSVS